jgi:alkylation response protein AidB-like acyl-CoA dehydrogenase
MAAEAGFEACDVTLQTHGGYGYAKECHVDRLWREVRLYKIAPGSPQMVLNYLSEHVLELPRVTRRRRCVGAEGRKRR